MTLPRLSSLAGRFGDLRVSPRVLDSQPVWCRERRFRPTRSATVAVRGQRGRARPWTQETASQNCLCHDAGVTLRAVSTVLVVEDERIIALDLRRTLLRHGYHVVATAATGADALRLAREFDPRIVIMDLRLFGPMDGVSTAHHLRAASHFALIYLSASHGDFTGVELTNPVALLDKPFTESQLLAALEVAEASLQRAPELVASTVETPSCLQRPSAAEQSMEKDEAPSPKTTRE